MAEAGKLAGGKAASDTIGTGIQEGVTQGILNTCVGEHCE
tara:strand:+ start:1069 stop:1188 length:120 start_codon:yes stop_codon:yes gene_type:complete